MNKHLLSLLTILCIALCVSGCGYTLVGLGSNLPEDIQTIYVESLVNQTQRPQVEQILTNAIADELLTRRRYEVVNSAGEADAILRGKVLTFRLRPVTFDQEGLATNFEVEIAGDMKFQRIPGADGEEGEVLWANSRYVFRQDYSVEDGAGFFDRENTAIEETSERFAKTLVTDLLEGF